MNKQMNEMSVIRSFNISDFKTSDDEFNIEGHAAVFGQTTNIGGWFDEVIERGAFNECDFSDVSFFVNHNIDSIPLARSRKLNGSSTMELQVDTIGLYIRANLDTENNTEAKTLHSSISRGDIDGMSFSFRIQEQTWENLDTEMPTRRIQKIAKVFEVSAVNNPAYIDTDISARDKKDLDKAKSEIDNARSNSKNDNTQNEIEVLRIRAEILSKF